MSCYYISFDQATKKTGYCVWLDGKYYKHGLFDHSSKQENDENLRLEIMYKDIVGLIEKYHSNVITIEDTQMQGNAKSYKLLCRLQGMIIGYCVSNNISYSIYMPSKWRSILGFVGKRKELKDIAIAYVKEKFGIVTGEDEAESICIGYAVLSQYK